MKAHKANADHSEQRAAGNVLDHIVDRDQATLLLEVFKHTHPCRRVFADRVGIRVSSPGKAECRAKGLVAPSERGEDGVFAVATDRHKAAIRRVLQQLRENFGRAEFAGR